MLGIWIVAFAAGRARAVQARGRRSLDRPLIADAFTPSSFTTPSGVKTAFAVTSWNSPPIDASSKRPSETRERPLRLGAPGLRVDA